MFSGCVVPLGFTQPMKKKSIEVLSVTHLAGPNMWTYRPVLEALVDIGDLEDCPSNTIPGFYERLSSWLPSLIEHRCSYEERGGFLRRVKEGTWPGHILEHVALELQTQAGMKTGFGKARMTHERGVYKVVIRTRDEAVGRAALESAKAQVSAARAAIEAARTSIIQAQTRVEAAQATERRILADIDDSELKAPRDGRIQYRVAEPGEVLAAGGRVLNMVDLSDVYMTFFLPTEQAGLLALGSEARIILDAAPNLAIPANISFVASVAQFTPKTVETSDERLKLMFRVKARIPPELLEQHLEYVKTGLPGMAWVRLDNQQAWPEALTVRLPQ